MDIIIFILAIIGLFIKWFLISVGFITTGILLTAIICEDNVDKNYKEKEKDFYL